LSTVRRSGDTIELSLSDGDAAMLPLLAEQVAMLLEADAGAGSGDPLEAMVGLADAPVAAPVDPAVQRLLPDAYSSDGDDAEEIAAQEMSEEFRRLMDGELRRSKAEALRAMQSDLAALGRDAGGSVMLRADRAEVWLQALNDIRLVVGSRLDVTEDMSEVLRHLAADDPRVPLFVAYERLTWLQESLVTAVDE
jgi:hypothetical protein